MALSPLPLDGNEWDRRVVKNELLARELLLRPMALPSGETALEVRRVAAGSIFEHIGLRPGHCIVNFQGQPVGVSRGLAFIGNLRSIHSGPLEFEIVTTAERTRICCLIQ